MKLLCRAQVHTVGMCSRRVHRATRGVGEKPGLPGAQQTHRDRVEELGQGAPGTGRRPGPTSPLHHTGSRSLWELGVCASTLCSGTGSKGLWDQEQG